MVYLMSPLVQHTKTSETQSEKSLFLLSHFTKVSRLKNELFWKQQNCRKRSALNDRPVVGAVACFCDETTQTHGSREQYATNIDNDGLLLRRICTGICEKMEETLFLPIYSHIYKITIRYNCSSSSEKLSFPRFQSSWLQLEHFQKCTLCEAFSKSCISSG